MTKTIRSTSLLAADLIASSPLGQQANFFNAGSAHVVDGVFYHLVLGALIRANIDHFVGSVGELIAHQAAKLARIDLVLAEEDASVASNRDNNGVFFVCVGHGLGIFNLRQ